MKLILTSICIGLAFTAFSQNTDSTQTPTLRSILLEQLRTTHNVKDWFVPASQAVQGLTAEQASWSDGMGNHSIGQLATHLIFWNERMLRKFNGEELEKWEGDNQETFTSFNKESWEATVKKLDEVLAAWEKVVETASEEKLREYYTWIAHIGTHNAYHTGQIIYIRKNKGWWDDSKGVK